jgi:hypothetical protein
MERSNGHADVGFGAPSIPGAEVRIATLPWTENVGSGRGAYRKTAALRPWLDGVALAAHSVTGT